jgi:hypothetical protein
MEKDTGTQNKLMDFTYSFKEEKRRQCLCSVFDSKNSKH